MVLKDDTKVDALDVTPIQREEALKLQVPVYLMEMGRLEQQYSEWVLKNFVEKNKIFRVSFTGLKDKVPSLIQENENKYAGDGYDTPITGKSNKKQGERGSRKLKRLQCLVNYEGKKEKRKEGGVILKLN